MPGSRPDIQFTRSTMVAEAAIGYAQTPRYFDADRGVLQSRVFADPVIYRQELASIFQTSWLFVGPENWLNTAGDFVTSRSLPGGFPVAPCLNQRARELPGVSLSWLALR
jgi:hypothetical protein